jgi:membrane associated rhomboid family serine protease
MPFSGSDNSTNFSRYLQSLSWTQILIACNVGIFLIGMLAPIEYAGLNTLELWGAYFYQLAIPNGELWRLITYQFLHANLGHLAFNMIALWFFGRAIEQTLGARKFLLFYFCCGIAAALFSSLLGALGILDGPSPEAWKIIPMIGASGSIYGLVAASAVLYPYARIQLLFPPIEMSLRTFSLAILGLALLYIIFDWSNAGGEAGHMGGMFMGFILIGIRQWWQRRHSSVRYY